MAMISTAYPDVTELTARFTRIFYETLDPLPDRIDDFFFRMDSSRVNERFSGVGTYGSIPLFTGSVTYADIAQGYDSTLTPLEFAAGMQIERALMDDDQHDVIDSRPKTLATAVNRQIQVEGARGFNNSFSVDTRYNSHSEGVALCSNSHTTTSGASTANGFDNLITGAFNLVNLATARVQMKGFRGDQAERISIMPDLVLFPAQSIYVDVFEVLNSAGRPDTANRADNVHKGAYKSIEWEYLTDVNDWWLIESSKMKSPSGNIWIDRVKPEFAFVEAFDQIIGKWRTYFRVGQGHWDWRWINGAQVS